MVLGEDVAQIVHDIKNPLTTIALEVQLLDGRFVEIEPEMLKRAVARIARNLEFVDHLVQDLLDVCAIDADRFAIQRARVGLRALTEQLLERVIATRDHDRVRLEAPAEVAVNADATRIERVIGNFIQNALKYTPETSNIVVSLAVQRDRVRLSVIDDGPGVNDEDRELIFEKYRRANNAGTIDGCGLGLYVAKRIIEAHGGRVGVESVHGAGACFFFELPLHQDL